LNKPDVGRKWIVEEGFKGFEDFEGMGLEELVLGGKEERPAVARGDIIGRELKV